MRNLSEHELKTLRSILLDLDIMERQREQGQEPLELKQKVTEKLQRLILEAEQEMAWENKGASA